MPDHESCPLQMKGGEILEKLLDSNALTEDEKAWLFDHMLVGKTLICLIHHIPSLLDAFASAVQEYPDGGRHLLKFLATETCAPIELKQVDSLESLLSLLQKITENSPEGIPPGGSTSAASADDEELFDDANLTISEDMDKPLP